MAFDQWAYYQDITILAGKIPASKTGIPLYIPVDQMAAGFSANAKADLGDVRFVKLASGLEVPIDVIQAQGKMFWKADVDSASNVTYRAYYGNAAENLYARTDPFGSENVYTDLFGAYHYHEDPATAGSGGIKDSTAQALHGTDQNGVLRNTNGKLAGDVLEFVGVPSEINYNNPASYAGWTGPTFSLWVYPDAVGDAGLIGQWHGGGNGNFYIGMQSSGKLRFEIVGSSNSTYGRYDTPASVISAGQWHHLFFTIDLSTETAIWLVNGVSQTVTKSEGGSGTPTVTRNAGRLLFAGCRTLVDQHLDGRMSELWINDSPKDADWGTILYNNQNDPSTFFTVSAEKANGETPFTPIITII